MLEWEDLPEEDREGLRILSERSFLAFLCIWFQLMQGEKWAVNWHHRYIAHCIEQIVRRERGSTLFNVPPGSGKTEMLSIHAPIWAMLQVSKVRNLNISFSDTLAKRNSRRTREIIKSSEFQYLWPYPLGTDQADEWQLLNDQGKTRAEVVSRSIGGQITGSRGGYMGPVFSGWINLDDPDKPESMFSEIKRKKVHETMVNTIRSRRGDKSKKHPTPIIAIQQRLHIDDSTAFLSAGGMGINFDLIKIPALINQDYIDRLPEPFRSQCIKDICSSDQVDGYWSFWPDNEDIGDLLALRDSDPYTFAGQYMQQPEALDGGIFKAGDFGYYGDDADIPMPFSFEYRFITADTATKTKTYNDYSVFAEWGVHDGCLYRLAYQRGKWEAPELRQNFLSFIKASHEKNELYKGNLRAVLVEDKASGSGLIQEVGRSSPVPITAVQRNIDKLTRAMDCQPHHHQGKVLLPYGDSANYEFVSEVGAFTYNDTHQFDDQTDVMMDAIDYAFIKPVTGSQAGLFIPSRLRR